MKYETTLFVPTHNRPIQLNRLLRFTENRVDRLRVVIADSSEEKQHLSNQRNVASSRMAGAISLINYRGWDVTDKYLDGLAKVDTPTVCICGDDDLVFAEQLVACSRFLDSHKDFSYARGRIVTFMDSRSVAPKRSIRVYPQHAVVMDDPVDRIHYHLKHYRSNFYSVKRTDSVRHNLRLALRPDIGRGLQERLVPILDLLDGKGALLEGLFMGRQIGQSMVDEQGVRTVPGKRLEGNQYATSLTRNVQDYLDLIVSEIRMRCADVQEDRIAGLRAALQKDIDAYFVEKAQPRRLSFAKLGIKLHSGFTEFRRMRAGGDYSKAVEALLAHVLSHRQGS